MRKRYQNGSLTKVNGRWIAQWRERGHRRKRTLGLVSKMTKTQARLALSAILEPINHNCVRTVADETFGQFVRHVFLPFYRRKWKPSTASTCERRIKGHLLADFSDRKLRDFNRDQLQDWLQQKVESGLSYSTVDHLRWDLNQIFRMAAEDEYMRKSPARLLFTPRQAQRQPKRRMSWEEVNRCLSVLELREKLIAMLALLAGMRPGEIFALTWEDVSPAGIVVRRRLYEGVIDTPKTAQSRRRVVLPDELSAVVEQWRKVCPDCTPEAWVFASERVSTPLRPENCWRRSFLPRLSSVGLGWVNFQVMRRTHASLMRQLEVDPKVVADQLGHSLDVNLNVYTESGFDQRREAVNQLASALRQRGRETTNIM